MLVHPWDAPLDDDEWRAVLERYPFGVLTTVGLVDGWPVAVPTQFTVAGPDEVVLHLARPNPVWRAIESDDRVLLTVATDWAYIPSDWKAVEGEDPRMGIPTTYYSAVVLAARAQVLDTPQDKAAVLTTQLAALQPDVDVADPAEHGRTLTGIRGLRLRVDHVKGKLKYGGNADDAHRAVVAEHLAGRDGPGDAAALAHLRRRHPYA
ncbi:MAG: FMN-binding negative transcriptional regulator [Actinomycetes bacterium]